jgi:hypothetical protein
MSIEHDPQQHSFPPHCQRKKEGEAMNLGATSVQQRIEQMRSDLAVTTDQLGSLIARGKLSVSDEEAAALDSQIAEMNSALIEIGKYLDQYGDR